MLRGFPPDGIAGMLELVRRRGWSITSWSPEIRTLEALLRSFDHSALDVDAWRQLDRPVSTLTPAIYAPDGINAEARYDVATLMAPVFDAAGRVAIALTLTRLRPQDDRRRGASCRRSPRVERACLQAALGRPPSHLIIAARARY